MTRVIVCGVCGRMGIMVARAVGAADDLEIVGGVETPGHEHVGDELGSVPGGPECGVLVVATMSGFAREDYDVIIDYSSPEQAAACARKAAVDRKGLVIGTTALSDDELVVIEEASTRCPVVLAPNTSVGVNVLFELARRAASLLGSEFDVELVEAHHRRKKDAPSGTALELARIVAEARGLDPRSAVRMGRSGTAPERPWDEIGVHSIRAGSIVGRHRLSFVSELEEFRLGHEALSREAFAAGAVRAARYVHGRDPGLYTMAHVLGLREDDSTG